ncbi:MULTISPECIES: GNAT family N-acetyltransferase [Psychrilyobacter]|uniref:GNAT family N-acetyltransferase n=1 Tax=Psychrilyobacter piezotolerans TaxID=2293438 RepID=A0ABX9KGD0_9FUSO|nr:MULTISPECIES: GNAT family N-acetyltransferase [Psychrilyobacter]MCS5422909.1 GNAT family N-acetyltransferase [Psychrilyobacter sp. S5]NDI78425.1 GNAT family N-acetyltransferase [Psychrilyobacter piezotolerans]RDE61149.1 GNAT family N-acetyltransferase [Psychrilyobacter sp. S5]REI40790.1 GNAT family N-acetyltransferase [Psychrilyobacter piezotolerans]
MEYRELKVNDIHISLFNNFERRQVVTKRLEQVDGEWNEIDFNFVDDWEEDEYTFLIKCLQNTDKTGGVVIGVFWKNQLKGFASAESKLFGSKQEYIDLSCIHISNDMRGRGIGKVLFGYVTSWAKKQGAKKLYISSHSAVETQAFYNKLGCVDAVEINKKHAEEEPYDRQLEFVL